MQYPSFHEACNLAKQSAVAQLLVQAIASLNTTQRYSRMTPEEVYNEVVALTQETQRAVAVLDNM